MECWQGITRQYPRMFAHWGWTPSVSCVWWTGGQEPGDGTMPSTGLCRVDIAECMSGLVNGLGGVDRSA